MISGLTIIRNSISNGYFIEEVIDQLKSICDEVIVLDGYSDDGTYELLKNIDDINLYQDNWDLSSSSGDEFRKITNLGLSRCNGDYVFYLQADELIHESNLPLIKKLIISNQYNSIQFDFVHLRYSLLYSIDTNITPEYSKAIRVIKNIPEIQNGYDAYTFVGDINPCFDSKIIVYHAGYVFIDKILNKMINHSTKFYTTNDNYTHRASLASKLLENIDQTRLMSIEDLSNLLEPYYKLKIHNIELPKCLKKYLCSIP